MDADSKSVNEPVDGTSESPNRSDARPQKRACTTKFSKATKVDEIDDTEDSSGIHESAANVEMKGKIPDPRPIAPLVKEVGKLGTKAPNAMFLLLTSSPRNSQMKLCPT